MVKGTASMGKRSGKKTHIPCKRCGGFSYHVKKKKCASCGFGATTTKRKYGWNKKNTK